MEAFPFTDAEWDPLKPVVDSILDAGRCDDDALAASLRLDLLDMLAVLRERHGDHPVLLETIADYTDDDAESAVLYRRAVAIAEEHGLPTLSIRQALAYTLMKLGEPAAAVEEFHTCRCEVPDADEDDRTWWAGMMEEASQAEPGNAPPPTT
jgi:hypothetical protein